jgi:hypothetical protein
MLILAYTEPLRTVAYQNRTISNLTVHNRIGPYLTIKISFETVIDHIQPS